MNWRYRLLVLSLRLVVLVARITGLKGHVVADAEGDAGYYALEAHKGFFNSKGFVIRGKSAAIKAFAAREGIPFVELEGIDPEVALQRRDDRRDACPNCHGSGCWVCDF